MRAFKHFVNLVKLKITFFRKISHKSISSKNMVKANAPLIKPKLFIVHPKKSPSEIH